MVRYFRTDPRFEEVYRQNEFWPLVGIALLLSDWIGRSLRKRYAAAPGQLPQEQDTFRHHVAQTATVAPRAALAADNWLNDPTR
jgi:hypothetical protein